jgi:hypothetical protein
VYEFEGMVTSKAGNINSRVGEREREKKLCFSVCGKVYFSPTVTRKIRGSAAGGLAAFFFIKNLRKS